jgi:hypothetical protein
MLLHKLRKNKRGFSTVIAVVLSLVILVVVVANVVLWNFTMSQVDWERTKEDIQIMNATRIIGGTNFTFQNKGAITVQLVSLWIDNTTQHSRYDLNLFINAGDTLTYVRSDTNLPPNAVVKVVTARGNIAVYSAN